MGSADRKVGNPTPAFWLLLPIGGGGQKRIDLDSPALFIETIQAVPSTEPAWPSGRRTYWAWPAMSLPTNYNDLLVKMSLKVESFDSWIMNWCDWLVQVLNEDLRLVIGQQERMLNGANVWNWPVAYDKLGVRYRLWRDAVERGEKRLPFTKWTLRFNIAMVLTSFLILQNHQGLCLRSIS